MSLLSAPRKTLAEGDSRAARVWNSRIDGLNDSTIFTHLTNSGALAAILLRKIPADKQTKRRRETLSPRYEKSGDFHRRFQLSGHLFGHFLV